jgi:hypothetical protein
LQYSSHWDANENIDQEVCPNSPKLVEQYQLTTTNYAAVPLKHHQADKKVHSDAMLSQKKSSECPKNISKLITNPIIIIKIIT